VSSPEDPRPVGDALRAVRRQLGTPAPSVLERVRADWETLVGPALAEHSEPLHLRSGVLRIGVDDPAWAGQFRYLADTLVTAFAERVPEAAIREISVTAARAPGGPAPTAAEGADEWSDGGPGPA
jgi:predicted nucleic acid-binding Zn ribbon protein